MFQYIKDQSSHVNYEMIANQKRYSKILKIVNTSFFLMTVYFIKLFTKAFKSLNL